MSSVVNFCRERPVHWKAALRAVPPLSLAESRRVRRAQPGSLHLLRRRRQQHSDSEQLQFGSSRRSDLTSDLVLSVHFSGKTISYIYQLRFRRVHLWFWLRGDPQLVTWAVFSSYLSISTTRVHIGIIMAEERPCVIFVILLTPAPFWADTKNSLILDF